MARRPDQPMPNDVAAKLAETGLLDRYAERPRYQRNDYLAWILGRNDPRPVRKGSTRWSQNSHRVASTWGWSIDPAHATQIDRDFDAHLQLDTRILCTMAPGNICCRSDRHAEFDLGHQ